MENQKMENVLNLALGATKEELERSETLAIGYDPREQTWEVIVKHSTELEGLEEMGVKQTRLLNQYSILTVPESRINEVADLPQIEFMEKPKRLYFAVDQAKAASCITYVQVEGSSYAPYLTGRGSLVAVIDSGIDYFHDDFRNEDGTTRILELWDQTLDRVFTEEEINEALKKGSRREARMVVPSVDGSGHGTAVAGIAAGNGRESEGLYRGAAFEARLLVVKLGVPTSLGFPRTTELMRALDYVVKRAVDFGLPVAVNVSIGNTYGSHDGTSLLETYIDGISNYGRNVIIIGSGNEAGFGGHISGALTMGNAVNVELSIAPYESGITVQLWKHYVDDFAITLVTPSGRILGPLPPVIGPQTLDYESTRILLYYGEPGPYSKAQEIYFDFMPLHQDYLQSGIWVFRLTPRKIVQGDYDFWLPSSTILNKSTYFLRSTPDTTLTIPSTASMALTVGAYNSNYQTYADFSGRGFTRVTNQVKPDLAAPGVNIMTTKNGGGYEAVTGTSFAAPFVTGSAALLMQWGIAEGRDEFLYGEKVKAYLIRGARQLPGYEAWPNPQLGWGALCVRDSLPV
ncbi:MAG: S8 family peptidase [Hungatella sp.]|nr:S8 family peptidase [Hungatella sp.]